MIFSLIYTLNALLFMNVCLLDSLFVCLFIFLFVFFPFVSLFVSVCLLACLSSASLPVGLCVFLFSCLFACLCVCISVRLLSACLPFVFLSVCVSVISSWEVISPYRKKEEILLNKTPIPPQVSDQLKVSMTEARDTQVNDVSGWLGERGRPA